MLVYHGQVEVNNDVGYTLHWRERETDRQTDRDKRQAGRRSEAETDIYVL